MGGCRLVLVVGRRRGRGGTTDGLERAEGGLTTCLKYSGRVSLAASQGLCFERECVCGGHVPLKLRHQKPVWDSSAARAAARYELGGGQTMVQYS